MRLHRVLLACCCWLGAVAHAFAVEGSGYATPLFAFSNGDFLTDSGKGSQMKDDFYSTMKGIISGAVMPLSDVVAPSHVLHHEALAANRPDVVLAVLGDQVETSDLRKEGAAELFRPLQNLLEQARSSVTLPYLMQHAQSSVESMVASIMHDGGYHVKSIGCGEGASIDSVPQLLSEPPADRPLVLLVCPQVDAAVSGTAQAIAAELGILGRVQGMLDATDKKHLTLFAGRPAQKSEQSRQQRRSILAAASQTEAYTECDALCQVHVQWLQGMLAILLFAVAAISGLCCLNMLDIPTRFEVPKEGQRTD